MPTDIRFLQGARELSPYLLVELLLPGGTVVALLLWIYRNQSKVWPRVQKSRELY